MRLNLMRISYTVMGVGLTVVKRPRLADVHDMSLLEGVGACLLIALSLASLLGLRYAARLLPCC